MPGHLEVDGEPAPQAGEPPVSGELHACVLIQGGCDAPADASRKRRGCKRVRELDCGEGVRERIEQVPAQRAHCVERLFVPWNVFQRLTLFCEPPPCLTALDQVAVPKVPSAGFV
jgi:hypothetical protein